MQIGLALPTMADGWTAGTYRDWCRITENGGFSSISCGERITFRNTEMLTTLAAAAALTETPRVFANLAISPWHATTLLAKQLATLDLISDGRLDVGLGVGGREQDYRSVGASMERRHQRVDDQVAEMRRLWSSEPALPDAPPLGPPPVQPGGPPLYAGALGPKSMARAARWATGISGFNLSLDPDEIGGAAVMAHEAWENEGREDRPRLVIACFYVLNPAGDAAAASTLARFTYEYLEIFGEDFAGSMAELASLSSPEALTDALGRVAAETPCDEVILVPGSVDPACGEMAADVLADLGA